MNMKAKKMFSCSSQEITSVHTGAEKLKNSVMFPVCVVCVLCADAIVDAGPSDGLVRQPLHGGTCPVRNSRTGLLLRALLTYYQILQLQGA